MATVSDLTITPLSGLNHIDALLDIGPDWNFLTGVTANTLYYTFSVSSGNEKNVTGQEAFTQAQQIAVKSAFNYLQQITGIQFVETAIGTNAQIHLANRNLDGSQTTGLCSWESSYTFSTGNVLSSYSANAYVYLDNVEWLGQNRDLTPGSVGYQTLLHELGHALGLKHPFENDVRLPSGQDSTNFSLMSYNDVGGPYSAFSAYDIAALNWLYGGDGLRGALGINSTGGGRYITGTTGADRITGTDGDDLIAGLGGYDAIDGGAGNDTLVFIGMRAEYTFVESNGGEIVVSHANQGTTTVNGVEQFSFTDGMFQRSQLLVDLTAPVAPTLTVSKNAAGYTAGNRPLVTGQAEANALVRVYFVDQLVAETRADANGVWAVVTSAFTDGLSRSVRATATDAAGNTSPYSSPVSFNVDATAPFLPSSSVTLAASGNQPIFSGTGEAGTTIQLVRISDATEIGRTVVKADGTWKLDSAALPNGVYEVAAVSVDIADNATSAPTRMQFTIDSPLNMVGDGLANRFTPGSGNNAIDGMGGLDTVAYTGARANFAIERGVYGVTVTDKSGALGTDNLINVERIQFGDTMVALDVDGAAGQVYRLYQAAFDRVPDAAGLAYWIKALDSGNFNLNDISGLFLNDTEARNLYSQDPSDASFVTKLYAHVLHRPAEGAGFDFWVNGLQLASRAEVLAFFSESPENQAQVIAAISNGIDYPMSPGS
jgi:serralysin